MFVFVFFLKKINNQKNKSKINKNKQTNQTNKQNIKKQTQNKHTQAIAPNLAAGNKRGAPSLGKIPGKLAPVEPQT